MPRLTLGVRSRVVDYLLATPEKMIHRGKQQLFKPWQFLSAKLASVMQRRSRQLAADIIAVVDPVSLVVAYTQQD